MSSLLKLSSVVIFEILCSTLLLYNLSYTPFKNNLFCITVVCYKIINTSYYANKTFELYRYNILNRNGLIHLLLINLVIHILMIATLIKLSNDKNIEKQHFYFINYVIANYLLLYVNKLIDKHNLHINEHIIGANVVQ